MTAASVEGASRRIVLWFRNDLRLRDNAIIHQAVQKLQAKEYDEVGPTAAAAVLHSSHHGDTRHNYNKPRSC